METIGVLIVEDQAMLRESLVSTIDSQPDMHVVASLADAAEAPAFVARDGVDLALMDVCTENDSSGIVAAKRIKQDSPKVRVVIMTGMPDITFVEQARDAGVDSFVYKNVGISELLSVMRPRTPATRPSPRLRIPSSPEARPSRMRRSRFFALSARPKVARRSPASST